MKHKPRQMALNSPTFKAAHAADVAAALELIKNGTAHMEAEVVPSVSDHVGSKLCSIGRSQQTLTGNRSGNTVSGRV